MNDTVDRPLSELVRRAYQISSVVDEPILRGHAFDAILNHLIDLTSKTRPDAAPRETDAPKSSPPHETVESTRRPPAIGPSRWVENLFEEGFFKTTKTIADVVERLKSEGHNILSRDVTFPLVRLVRLHKLRRQRGIDGESKRQVWIYGNG